MTKNVFVVDENGNELTPTYAKRAKGLVKQGRARWVDENTICLACPPIELEDNIMENRDKIADVIENIEVVAESKPAAITTADVLARMDKIIAQGDELSIVMQTIKDLPVNESPEGGLDGQARAEAIGKIYANREVTNQKMLGMLERMLNPGEHKPDMLEKLADFSFADVDTDVVKMILDFAENHS